MIPKNIELVNILQYLLFTYTLPVCSLFVSNNLKFSYHLFQYNKVNNWYYIIVSSIEYVELIGKILQTKNQSYKKLLISKIIYL
jgi:hypothetical protein